MSQAILNEAQVRFKKAVDHTLHEFANIHTGKASPSMVEGIMVEAYGSMMRIKDCAAISTPDARQIVIQPWDKGLTQAISKAIQIANRGFEVEYTCVPLNQSSWSPLNTAGNRPQFSVLNRTAAIDDLISTNAARFYRVRVYEP